MHNTLITPRTPHPGLKWSLKWLWQHDKFESNLTQRKGKSIQVLIIASCPSSGRTMTWCHVKFGWGLTHSKKETNLSGGVLKESYNPTNNTKTQLEKHILKLNPNQQEENEALTWKMWALPSMYLAAKADPLKSKKTASNRETPIAIFKKKWRQCRRRMGEKGSSWYRKERGTEQEMLQIYREKSRKNEINGDGLLLKITGETEIG